MAAGLGYKEFSTGDVLTAADANGYLASQVVMVFASAAARTSAIASPQEGMISYLKDTNATQYYSGSAWVGVGGTSPLTTKGDLYTFSTVDARLGVGANGTVLTADSAEATGLKWATPGGGAVVQVKSATYSTSTATTSTTLADTGLSLSITPTSASNKILVMISQQLDLSSLGAEVGTKFAVLRGATSIYSNTLFNYRYIDSLGAGVTQSTVFIGDLKYMDSPATTSATTYKTQFALAVSGGTHTNTAQSSSRTSTIILMEVTP
jgi:hypothetical protein